MSWSDIPLMTDTDELQSLVHVRWQEASSTRFASAAGDRSDMR
jgi:hypothetical protein